MTTFLLALHLLAADTAQHPFPYSIKESPSKFEWKKFEAPVSKHFRDSILDVFKLEYPFFFEHENTKSEIYDSSFHFVHLNNDRFPDVVYEGWTSGEGTMVDIYINRQWRMEKVFTEYMKVIDWTFVNKQLNKIVILNYGCCASNVEFEMHYQVDGNFKFSLIRQRAILVGMDDVIQESIGQDAYFEEPVSFKTLNQGYALRYSPEISNKVPEALDIALGDRTSGNIIALYPSGAEGIAWGYQKDATGREWWLVEMQPQADLSFTHFWNNEERPTWYFGWMSSRFLQFSTDQQN